ncbi:MAG: hypothetical protein ACRDI3_05525 [Actinomycetota bacterium]
MTMPRMARVWLVALLLIVPACASEDGSGSDEALAAVEDLESDMDGLRTELDDLQADLDDFGSERDGLERRLGSLSKRLGRALEGLRASLRDIRGAAGGAPDEAARALGRAEDVAAQLQVLEERYEYHLRRYHDG